jgi:AraC-like DNA-binding protein
MLSLYTGVVGKLQTEPQLPKDVTQELAITMVQIVDYLQSPSPMSDFYAHRALANMFDIIVAHCYTEMIPAAALGQDNGMLDVKRYIDEHYSEVISAEDLASISHCSKGHLFRTFKRCFNLSPLAYQQNLRFEAAQRLLRFTPLRCYEIAQRVGFSNVYYFHRLFKKRMGITPKRYRQSVR